METLAFTLTLIDKVSANAHKAAESVRRVQGQAKSAQKAIDFSAEVKKTQAQLDKLKIDPKGFQQAFKLQKQLREEREKLKKATEERQGFWSSFTKALPFRSVSQYTQAAFTGQLMAEGVMRGAGFLVDAAKKVVDIISEGFKAAINEGSKQEVMRLGERLSLGGAGGKDFEDDVNRFAGRTGWDDGVIRAMMLPLRRSGFDQQGSRSAFAGAADIAAGLGKGGDAATVQGILDTFQTIKLKGGIGEKQLVGMGVSPKDVYADIAKQLGISTDAAAEKVSSGKIDDPQRIINAILSGVEKAQGGELGTGAIEYSKTFEAKWRKITELPGNFFKKVNDSPSWAKLTAAADRFLQAMDPDGPIGKRIFGSLDRVFSQIVDWIDTLTSEDGIDSFAAGIQTALDGVKSLVAGVASLVDLLRSAAAIADKVAAPLARIFGEGENAGENEVRKRLYQKRIEEEAKERAGFLVSGGFSNYLDNMGISVPGKPVAGAGGKSVSVGAPVVQVNVQGGANPEETGRKIGKAAAPHISRDIERAAQEAGG
jgi:hypothetical protein